MKIKTLVSVILVCQIISVSTSRAEESSQPDRWQATEHFLQQKNAHSMVVLHKGKVVYDYGKIAQPLLVHSIRKAVLNGLFGLYVKKGQIDLNATLAELDIDDNNPLSETEKSATIRQLMQSRSGVYHPATAETVNMASQRPARGAHEPGEAYYYNNWSFNVLGHIFTQLTGKGVLETTLSELAELTGMQDTGLPIATFINPDDNVSISHLNGFYQFEPEHSKYGAYHMRLSARDLAAYGQWMLDNLQGRSNDLPANWVAESSRLHSVTNAKYNLGYGLLWNVVKAKQTGNANSFYHTGLGVHALAVYPNSELVFVYRVNTEQPGFNRDYVMPQLAGLVHRAVLSG